MVRYQRPMVVVGVDGSPPALSAARWAADEAVQRHQGLHVVYAAHLPAVGYPAFGYSADFVELIQNQGENLLAGVAADVTSRHPGLEVSTTLTRSDPRSALVDASRGASLTVVGSLGHGRVREVLLGSVALHVAAHGRSPVAVIPFDRDHRGGPILVGVDGSAHSAAAVGYAFDEAAVRGTGVVAVLAFDTLARQGFARRPVTFDDLTPRNSMRSSPSSLPGGWRSIRMFRCARRFSVAKPRTAWWVTPGARHWSSSRS